MEAPRPGILIHGAAEVATLAGGLRRGRAQGDLALLRGPTHPAPDDPAAPAVAAWEGRILAVGRRDEVDRILDAGGYPYAEIERIDAAGGTVTPGLVDAHTHLLFGGTRESELVARQRGASYLEILAAGGGILSTVEATRRATDEDLLAHGRRWLTDMLGHGTTTVEAKSGYGLDITTELRLLRIADRLARDGPVDVVPTFLGAHAVPAEYRDLPDASDAYVGHVIREQLPAVVRQGIARSCDVFCEAGVFSADQSRRILRAAQEAGLDVRLHADELAPSGGAELAAEIGALSADHLATPSPAGIDALAAAADAGRPVVATLLPATTWFLMKPAHAPARTLVDRGVPVALGTDFNPGTSPTPSLPLVMTLAILQLGLSPAEALAAVTVNAAHAIGVAEVAGAIEPGRIADIVIWRVPTAEQLAYWPAAELVAAVVKRGHLVLDRRPPTD